MADPTSTDPKPREEPDQRGQDPKNPDQVPTSDPNEGTEVTPPAPPTEGEVRSTAEGEGDHK